MHHPNHVSLGALEPCAQLLAALSSFIKRHRHQRITSMSTRLQPWAQANFGHSPVLLGARTMDMRRNEEGGAADASGAAAGLDPVALHALDELQRGLRDAPHALLEVEPRSKAVHVETRVYGPATAGGINTQQALWRLALAVGRRRAWGRYMACAHAADLASMAFDSMFKSLTSCWNTMPNTKTFTCIGSLTVRLA